MDIDSEMVPLTDREALEAMQKQPMARYVTFDEHVKKLEGLKVDIKALLPKHGRHGAASAGAGSAEAQADAADRRAVLEREFRDAKAVTAACFCRTKLLEYMEDKPAATQSMEAVEGALNALSGFGLSVAEQLQIVNLRPTSMVLLYVIVEDLQARLSNEDMERLLEVVRTRLPPPNADGDEDEEDEEDGGEGGEGGADGDEEDEDEDGGLAARGVDAEAAAAGAAEVAEENELLTQVVRAPKAPAAGAEEED